MRRMLHACGLFTAMRLLVLLQGFARSDEENPSITAAQLQAILEKVRAKHDVPALAAGVIRGGEQSCVAVVGVRKRGTETPAMPADEWHLGSNTKPITALLIALLIDRGLLDWDTPLEQIFPEHADAWNADLKKTTPAHLLTHTSGLPGMGPLAKYLIAGSRKDPSQDREEIVKSLGTVKLTARPGEKYDYSNLGYVVLGAIIDRRGKAPWEKQIEKKIFQPLGIKQWGLGPVGTKDAEVAWPHTSGGKPVPADGVMDNPAVMNSAGRVHMSVADCNLLLAETMRLARGEKGLLKPGTAQKLFTNPYPVSQHSLSGWAGFRKHPGAKGLVLEHDGSNTFNYCSAILVPDQNLAYCVLTNQGGPNGPGEKACHDAARELRSREKR